MNASWTVPIRIIATSFSSWGIRNKRSWLNLGFARLLNCPRSKDRGYEFPVSASWTVPIRIIATSFSSWIIG
ncbi:MAG: hypothetical protein AB7T22_13125, partial [Calditrichaceae bacterium]